MFSLRQFRVMRCGFRKMTNRDYVNALHVSYLKFGWCAKLHYSNLKLKACNFTTNLSNVVIFAALRKRFENRMSTVSSNYHSFSYYFQVHEWICMEMYLQPIDRGWKLANNRLISLKIELLLANCSCKQTCDTLN